MTEATLVFLFNEKNQILLGMKKRGFWHWKRNWIWWKIEKQETCSQAAIRELYEETKISIEENQIQQIWLLYFYFDANSDWNFKVYVYSWIYDWDFEETDEIKPCWRNISDIPFEQMREDDKYWLPRMLDWETNICEKFNFDENNKIYNRQIIK